MKGWSFALLGTLLIGGCGVSDSDLSETTVAPTEVSQKDDFPKGKVIAVSSLMKSRGPSWKMEYVETSSSAFVVVSSGFSSRQDETSIAILPVERSSHELNEMAKARKVAESSQSHAIGLQGQKLYWHLEEVCTDIGTFQIAVGGPYFNCISIARQ